MTDHSSRKADHLDLAATDRVAFRERTNLLEQVGFVHDALPELHVREIDVATTLIGRPLRAPLLIAGMTGGLERADAINRDLAAVAEELGLAFGFGSMRPLLEGGVTAGYRVRDVAPTATLLGNLGVVQAARSSTSQLVDLVGATDVNALCVHLNPAQEVVQPGGDEDFRGGLDAIARLVAELPVPVIVKETGCGLSRAVGRRLIAAGVRHVDVGGAGGTSWVGVETLRERAPVAIGEQFWDWGVPTGAAVAQLSGLPLEVIATGGVKTGLDVARAVALGARVAGVARPLLMAWNDGGVDAVRARVAELTHGLRVACLLTGSASLEALRSAPLVLGPGIAAWVPRESPLAGRDRPW